MAEPERPTGIVIADDDDLVRAVLRMALTGPGVHLREARDSDALRQVLEDGPADLVILDISIPGPGLSANIDAVRSAHPTAKILILSGDHEVPNAETHRVDDFARKPIELSELRARVAALTSAPTTNGAP